MLFWFHDQQEKASLAWQSRRLGLQSVATLFRCFMTINYHSFHYLSDSIMAIHEQLQQQFDIHLLKIFLPVVRFVPNWLLNCFKFVKLYHNFITELRGGL